FVVVTPYQDEWLTVSSRISVMVAGRIVQVSTPAALYEFPATRFVAVFIGGINLFEGRVLSHDLDAGLVRVQCDTLAEPVLARHTDYMPEGTAVSVAVRPEKIDVHEQRPVADNVAVGKV